MDEVLPDLVILAKGALKLSHDGLSGGCKQCGHPFTAAFLVKAVDMGSEQ